MVEENLRDDFSRKHRAKKSRNAQKTTGHDETACGSNLPLEGS
jgi:hypothetical protein